jgi:hypothetical protein
MSTLSPQAAQIRATSNQVLTLVSRLSSVDCLPRQYVAEMIIVRVFALFEAIVEDSACRMVCGAQYCDGTNANLRRRRPARGHLSALKEMQMFGRTEPHKSLRWNRSRDIKKNLECLFPVNEHFINTLVGHGQFISDLRKVRNHIAHGNYDSKCKFTEVVRNYYGANVYAMTPGRMLLSARFRPVLVEQFCRKTQTILIAAIKG